MKILLRIFLFFIIIVFFTSCAATYKPVSPLSLNYAGTGNSFSYKLNVLKDAGNKKMARKEKRKHISVMAVKFTNNRGNAIKYGEDFLFYTADQEVKILSPSQATTILKQSVPYYLLYMGLTPVKLTVNSGPKTGIYPLGMILGACFAAYNMSVSERANKQLRIELERNNIIGRKIGDGETFIGLVAIQGNCPQVLSVKMCN